MKKRTWIFLALLLNTGLIFLFLFLYRDFKKLETASSTPAPEVHALEEFTPAQDTSKPKGDMRDQQKTLDLETPKTQNNPKDNLAGPPASMAAEAPAPEAAPVAPSKKSAPLRKKVFEKELSSPHSSHPSLPASAASSYEKVNIAKNASAKTISRFPLVVGMLLLSSLFLNLALLLLYRTYATQSHMARKRQDFVAAVTHELRTPLTSIKMFGELLEGGLAVTEEKRKEYYEIINKESSRLSRLIDNILQLSSLEKKNFHPQLITAPVQDTLIAILPELKMLAESSGFILKEEIENTPPITFDREALEQILFIFLENSLKFAAKSQNKSLCLSLKSENEKVVLSWQDEGPGVPEDELKKIFEPFYRIESELTRATKGTGIGLAMAKMLAEAMGAKIVAKNLKPGLLLSLIF